MNTEYNSTHSDQALVVKKLLCFAVNNYDFQLALSENGTETLSNFPLSSEAKVAILYGDIDWID